MEKQITVVVVKKVTYYVVDFFGQKCIVCPARSHVYDYETGECVGQGNRLYSFVVEAIHKACQE